MKIFRKRYLIYLLILVISYVAGINLFIYLKFWGLSELKGEPSSVLQQIIPWATVMGIDMALAIGLLELYVFPKWKHLSFRRFIGYKYLILTLNIIVTGLVIFIGSEHSMNGKPLSELIDSIPQFLVNGLFLSGMVYTLIFSIFFNVLKTISEYIGPRAVASALLGRYQHPAEEDLTFIFIDLKSSTSIAERLGHVQYSLFIDKCFQKLTESIRAHNASVYQFVGDEAVLLWKTKDAVKTIAPVLLYYDFVNRLDKERMYFMSNFKEVPHFRASVHGGMVAVTEIHSVKTDIVYHGDVLNTCARIMTHGSQSNKDLLVSSFVAEWMKYQQSFSTQLIDDVVLRGKDTPTSIYEVKMAPVL